MNKVDPNPGVREALTSGQTGKVLVDVDELRETTEMLEKLGASLEDMLLGCDHSTGICECLDRALIERAQVMTGHRVVCDECKGAGSVPYPGPDPDATAMCAKCGGDLYLPAPDDAQAKKQGRLRVVRERNFQEAFLKSVTARVGDTSIARTHAQGLLQLAGQMGHVGAAAGVIAQTSNGVSLAAALRNLSRSANEFL